MIKLSTETAHCIFYFYIFFFVMKEARGKNYPLILQIKHNTETNIKRSMLYGIAPGIECYKAYRDPTKPPFFCTVKCKCKLIFLPTVAFVKVNFECFLFIHLFFF